MSMTPRQKTKLGELNIRIINNNPKIKLVYNHNNLIKLLNTEIELELYFKARS